MGPETIIFKIIGQKTAGKLVLIAVVDQDFFGVDTPNIFEAQAHKQPNTIYTGTYPTIKIHPDFTDREDLKGSGIAGILTGEQWYCVKKPAGDPLGISLALEKK